MAPLGYPGRRQSVGFTRWRTVRLLVGPVPAGRRPLYLRLTDSSWRVLGDRRGPVTRRRYVVVEAPRVRTTEHDAYYRAVRRWTGARVAGSPHSRRDLTELRMFVRRYGRRWLRPPASWRGTGRCCAVAIGCRADSRSELLRHRQVAALARQLAGVARTAPTAGGTPRPAARVGGRHLAPVPALTPRPVPDLPAPRPVPDLPAMRPVPDLSAPRPVPDLPAPRPVPVAATPPRPVPDRPSARQPEPRQPEPPQPKQPPPEPPQPVRPGSVGSAALLPACRE